MSIDLIKTAQKRNQRLISMITSEKIPDDGGRLYVDHRGGSIYCYERMIENGKLVKKEYIGTGNSERVRELYSIRYRKELLSRLEHNQRQIDRILMKLRDCSHEAILTALPRQYSLVSGGEQGWRSAYINSRYKEIKKWADADYKINEAPMPEAEHYAKDGRRIRSKGECIIYNILLDLRIPFRYDSIIESMDHHRKTKRLSPDFLIQCFDGTFIVIEHLGMLGDIRYGIDFGEKCYWYINEGFVLGKNFFVTSDDIKGGTDSESISETLQQVAHMFYGY